MADGPRILLITSRWPYKKNQYFTTLKLISILKPITSEIKWVISEQSDKNYPDFEDTLIRIKDAYPENFFILKYIYLLIHQIKVISVIGRLSHYDTLMFAFGADYFIFPIIAGKILGKKIILRTDGRQSVMMKLYLPNSNPLIIRLLDIIEKISYSISDRIVPESRAMVNIYSLQHYIDKISIGGLFVDTDIFKNNRESDQRYYNIGFIGRFSQEKGILQLLKALSLFRDEYQMHVIIIGEGELQEEVMKVVEAMNQKGYQITLCDWIDNKLLPNYLNNLQVLVIPSFKEGLPNVAIEAMACGCILLASEVGGITDLIDDETTGFLMEGNSPVIIADNIRRVLNSPNLAEIQLNAEKSVFRDYTYKAAVSRYKKIFELV